MTQACKKGIVLAGGTGSRLHPLTLSVSKQLLPVYDKPMIYYPIATLMQTGIREICIVTTPHDQAAFEALLGDGSDWGISLSYAVQPEPNGIAEAFLICDEFIDGDPVALILGDNIFFGHDFPDQIQRAAGRTDGATIFAYHVKNPQRYGVVSFDDSGKALDIDEKPDKPMSNFAVTGFYFYDARVTEFARALKPSGRGELEITDLNRVYLEHGSLNVEIMDRGSAWLDTGTHESLLAAASFIAIVEQRQGLKICCPEEIAFHAGYIDVQQLKILASRLEHNEYGDYLLRVAEEQAAT
ncbi:MAG: glucose-1-phosphate thymidylyltransferase RfbA [Pseudomonadota bacterium]